MSRAAKAAWISLGLLLFAVVCSFGWYKLSLRPANAGDHTAVRVTFNGGQSVADIAHELQNRGVIRSRFAFMVYLVLHAEAGKIQTGSYELLPSYAADQVADILTNGKIVTNRLTVPEGSTVKQIKALAQAKGIKTADFDAALGASFSQSFLSSRPSGVSLEGYLFPDTYQISPTTKAADLVRLMLDNFDRRVGGDLRKKFSDRGLTLHQGLTVASIVEKEVPKPSDQALVAQVFYNRLKANMPLESDVTVQYAADLQGTAFSLDLDSPYNTYRHPGLPPGPICNPGLDSINAAANPSPTDALYFLTDKNGQLHLAKTFAEHQQNVQKYLN